MFNGYYYGGYDDDVTAEGYSGGRRRPRNRWRGYLEQIYDEVVPRGYYLRKGIERVVVPSLEGKSKGLTVPGYNYLGPFNSTWNGKPTGVSDEAAKRHDEAYAELQKKGVNPYFRFNDADRKFLEDIKGRTDVGSRIGHSLFTAKREFTGMYDKYMKAGQMLTGRGASKRPASDFESPRKKKRAKGNSRPVKPAGGYTAKDRMFAVKKFLSGYGSKNNMADEQHFKKPKLVQKKVKGNTKQIIGRGFPLQKHFTVLTGVVSSSANEYGWSLRPILTLDTIQRHLFNPRYFQEWMTQAGGNTFGLTKTIINAISGSNVAKGIFQFGANATAAAVESSYKIHGNDVSTNVSNVNPPDARAEFASVYHGIATVLVGTEVKLFNNYIKPVTVTVYEVLCNQDYVFDASAEADLVVHMGHAMATSASLRSWIPGSTTINADSAPTSTDYENLTFSFNRCYSNSKVFKYWKIKNKRIVKLEPGEMTKFRVYWKPLRFNVADTVFRLQDMGYDCSVLGAASAIVGLNEQVDTFSLDKMMLKGFDKFLLYQVRGADGHATATDVQGVFPGKCLIQEKIHYKWSIKGAMHPQLPTLDHRFTATADALILDEEHQSGV